MNSLSLTILISTLISFTASAEKVKNTWLCVTEDSTGFSYKNGKWEHALFDVSDDKFIVRPIKESDGPFYQDKDRPYGVFDLGDDTPSKLCSNSEFIKCSGLGQLFFHPDTGRFIKTYPYGYWNGADNNNNTPHISRGRCTKI